MKKISLIILLLSIYTGFAQNTDLNNLYRKGEYDKAIELAQAMLKSSPDDFEAQLILLKIYNSRCDYQSAGLLVTKLKSTDEKFLTESLKTNYGSGNIKEAKRIYDHLIKNSNNETLKNELLKFGLITGLDPLYNDWKIHETESIVFHFQPSIAQEKIKHLITSRQKAFDNINNFFNATLPKKIDFFVWDTEESYNSSLKTNLGFTVAQFCISHNRINQSPGHEIAHNISFWKNPQLKKARFINEGIGVCFDGQGNNRLEAAGKVYRKNPVNIKEIWKSQTKIEENILYPIAGAFVDYLIQYDKEKFLRLAEDQTFESAQQIYVGNLNELINNFIKTLEQPK